MLHCPGIEWSHYMNWSRKVVFLCVFFTSSITAQDGKNTPRQVIFLGTIKGEITKVSEGGRKIEVKYKELVASAKSSTGTSIRGTSGKFRPPAQKELVFKEKNQELELRLQDESVVRLLDGTNPPAEKKSSTGKSSKSEDASDSEKQQDDKSDKKSSTKKTTKKSQETQHPGKPATPASLAKGQIIIVSVAREDMPGFSRLIATTVYVLGEK